ncbi:MAG: RNA-processing protein [Methanophagales archaeon]|nr:RNA-processing protein [Methanophagales archaeon]
MIHHVRIPQDRIGVLIGNKGLVKSDIEKKSGSTITVDSIEGVVQIEGVVGGDPLKTLRVAEMVKAIGRGFSPENAFVLLYDDLLLFEVISLSHLTPKTLNRVKGRVIGRNGKTRLVIENLAEVKISVYGKTISLIGYSHNIKAAYDAISMLIQGSPHSAVYSSLDRKRRAEEEEQEQEQAEW